VVTLFSAPGRAAPGAAAAERAPVRPGFHALEIAQDRGREKAFLAARGLPVVPFAIVAGAADLDTALRTVGRPAVLKTTAFGYDGKGQVRVNGAMNPADAWEAVGSREAVLEAFVDLRSEVSVIGARGMDGSWSHFGPIDNVHRHHILDVSAVPADVSPAIAGDTVEATRAVMDALDYVGILCVEFFVARDGRLFVNELAPRPHNSGHWTIDACAVSQFEQLVRAVCGLPLGDPGRFADAVMDNLLGDEVECWPAILAEPGARLHLYGKGEIRPGRKLGHVTRITRNG
jgi:5-(carboxyamino)imidazole ribonucleotide synthase